MVIRSVLILNLLVSAAMVQAMNGLGANYRCYNNSAFVFPVLVSALVATNKDLKDMAVALQETKTSYIKTAPCVLRTELIPTWRNNSNAKITKKGCLNQPQPRGRK